MAELNETPSGNRIHIAFFGLRNAGKSTLVNAFTGQPLAIVSDVAGTTTDPVSKAMEILPLGPCLITDTAGLDDVGELGRQRVEKTLKVLATTDIAVWVWGDELSHGEAEPPDARNLFLEACKRRCVTVLDYRRGDSVEELKQRIAAVKLVDVTPGLLDGLVTKGDRVVCVCPIDASAPKGRLILPQVQVIRECLDMGVPATVCQPAELAACLRFVMTGLRGRLLVITDSQAFNEVNRTIEQSNNQTIEQFSTRTIEQSANRTILLSSFSILFARQKGDLDAYLDGLRRLDELQDGDRVLVAEGCTHHRQCNDIGAVKIPKALQKLTGKNLVFEFASGIAFEGSSNNLNTLNNSNNPNNRTIEQFSLVIQCGGCMLTRREVLRRIALAQAAGVPIVNYGMLLAKAAGLPVEKMTM